MADRARRAHEPHRANQAGSRRLLEQRPAEVGVRRRRRVTRKGAAVVGCEDVTGRGQALDYLLISRFIRSICVFDHLGDAFVAEAQSVLEL